MKNHNPFRYFKTSPEIIRLAAIMYIQFPLSLRNVEDLLHEHSIDICHVTVRYWWNKFGPLFAREIRKKRMHPIPNHSNLGNPLRVFRDGNSFLVTDILRPGFSAWRVSMIDTLFVGIYLAATVIPGD